MSKLWSEFAANKKDNNLTDFIIKSNEKDRIKLASLWSYDFKLLEMILFDKNNNVKFF